MLKKIYDVQTITDNNTVTHNFIITANKHTPEYQKLKKSLKGYFRTVECSPSYAEIEQELNNKNIDEKIKNYILNQFN